MVNSDNSCNNFIYSKDTNEEQLINLKSDNIKDF